MQLVQYSQSRNMASCKWSLQLKIKVAKSIAKHLFFMMDVGLFLDVHDLFFATSIDLTKVEHTN
jgi:hypothetical protein